MHTNTSSKMILGLPSGINDTLSFTSVPRTIDSLKIIIEKLYGIPSEVQILSHNEVEVNNDGDLQKIDINNSQTVIIVTVDAQLIELVSFCLQENSAVLQQILLQHGDELNSILVASMISATKGFPSSLASILSLNNNFKLDTTTEKSGRTVLHAAVSSGSLKCVEGIKKHAGLGFEKLLYVKDKTGSTPIHYLSTCNLRMLNYINKFVSTSVTIQDIRENSHRCSIAQMEKPEIKSDNNISGVTKENMYVVEDDVSKLPPKDSGCDTKTAQRGSERDTKMPSEECESEIIASSKQSETDLNIQLGNGGSEIKVTAEESDASMVEILTQDLMVIDQAVATPPSINKKLTNQQLLSRPKSENGLHSPLRTVKKPVRIFLVSPISSTGKATSLKKQKPVTDLNSQRLPAINNNNKTPALNGSKTLKHTGPDLLIPTFARRPLPPTHDKKKRPVAGVLKESSARKFSAANRNMRTSSDDDVSSKHLTPRRPASADGEVMIKSDSEKSPTQKVRRISLIQNPHKSINLNETKTDNPPEIMQTVIEIEKDRMEKPWNNWIKAVTVDADSEEAKTLANNPVTEQPKPRKISLQVNNGNKNRKKSFEQWVLYKTQEEIAELNRLRDENEHKNENEAESKWKHGKTFEEWKKEKDEYDRLVKEEEEYMIKEEKQPTKFLNGKTFEQWQKEFEEKKKEENEMRKIRQAKNKEDQENHQQKRRKESTAKYEQWLLEKEIQEIEKEFEAKQIITKRKISTVKTLNDNKTRKRSMVKTGGGS